MKWGSIKVCHKSANFLLVRYNKKETNSHANSTLSPEGQEEARERWRRATMVATSGGCCLTQLRADRACE